MEAVKQGSATVGLKSKDYAVLVALKVWSSVFTKQYSTRSNMRCFKCFFHLVYENLLLMEMV